MSIKVTTMLVVLALGLATSYASSECQHTTCVYEKSKVNPTDTTSYHRIRVIHKNSIKEGWTTHHGPSSKPPTCNVNGGFCDDADHYTHECKYDIDADECTCTCAQETTTSTSASETTTSTSGQTTVTTCNSDQWLDGTTCKSCPVAAAGVQGYKCNGTTKTPYGWDGVQRRKKGAGTWSSIKRNKHCIDPTNSKPNRGRGAQIGGSHSSPSFTIAQAKTKCKNDETCAGIMDWNTNTNKRLWYKCTYKKSNPAESGANAPYIKTKNNRDMYVITRNNNVQCNKNSECGGTSQCKNNNQCETT